MILHGGKKDNSQDGFTALTSLHLRKWKKDMNISIHKKDLKLLEETLHY